MHRLPVIVALLAFAGALPAKLYKWVDEDGNVTYSERKPPDKPVEEVKLIGVPEVTPEQARQRLEQLNEKADALRKDRTFKENYTTETAEREARLKENCETARQNLRILETASRVKAQDGSFIDDSARQAQIESTRKQIQDSCD